MISNIPNLVYIAPTTKEDYLAVLDWSIEQTDYPVAIRVLCRIGFNRQALHKEFFRT